MRNLTNLRLLCAHATTSIQHKLASSSSGKILLNQKSKIRKLLFSMFNVKSDENQSLYVEFVHDILNTTYLNFKNLNKYKGIEAFENADYLEIAREMEKLIPLVGLNYRRIMTEVMMNKLIAFLRVNL